MPVSLAVDCYSPLSGPVRLLPGSLGFRIVLTVVGVVRTCTRLAGGVADELAEWRVGDAAERWLTLVAVPWHPLTCNSLHAFTPA